MKLEFHKWCTMAAVTPSGHVFAWVYPANRWEAAVDAARRGVGDPELKLGPISRRMIASQMRDTAAELGYLKKS